MAVEFDGFLYNNVGTAIQSATADAFDRNTTTPNRGTTTTDPNGYWTLSIATEGRYDIRITSGSSVRWYKYDASTQMQELEVNVLKIRDSNDSHTYEFVPSDITANRTLTIPLLAANDTLAVLDLAQTFAGAKTFSAALTISATTGNVLVVDTNVFVVDATNNRAGFGTASPAVMVDITGEIATRRGDRPLVNGANNNVTLQASTLLAITGPTGAFSISGFLAGADGQILIICCEVAQAMTITNEGAASTAGNRIITGTGADVVLSAIQGATVEFIYNATLSRWVLVRST